MAGTRASAKALRLMLSWVVEIAGYEPTPSEEIVDKRPRAERGTPASAPRNTGNRAESPNKGSSRRQTAPTSSEHGVCPLHNVPWRQNSNDRGTWLSHKDGEGWCNESSVRRQMEEQGELPDEPPSTDVIDVNGEVVPETDTILYAVPGDEPTDLDGVLSFLGITQPELEKDILAMPWDNFLQLAGDRAPEVAIERFRKIQEEGDGSV